MNQHADTLFSQTYPSAKVRWWLTTIGGAGWDGSTFGHIQVLRGMIRGRSAEDAEALSYCYQRVVHEGARSASGLWCVCLSENPPSAGEARGYVGGDGMSALIAVKADLEHAADLLPISWSTTQQVFEAQQRASVYMARLTYYRRNLGVREIDRWLEPRDAETGRPRSRALVHYLMARSLGGAKDSCEWPRQQPIRVRALTAQLKEAA